MIRAKKRDKMLVFEVGGTVWIQRGSSYIEYQLITMETSCSNVLIMLWDNESDRITDLTKSQIGWWTSNVSDVRDLKGYAGGVRAIGKRQGTKAVAQQHI